MAPPRLIRRDCVLSGGRSFGAVTPDRLGRPGMLNVRGGLFHGHESTTGARLPTPSLCGVEGEPGAEQTALGERSAMDLLGRQSLVGNERHVPAIL
jgi:hypothetical protein